MVLCVGPFSALMRSHFSAGCRCHSSFKAVVATTEVVWVTEAATEDTDEPTVAAADAGTADMAATAVAIVLVGMAAVMAHRRRRPANAGLHAIGPTECLVGRNASAWVR